MRILIVTPAKPGSRLGNRVTALRWRRLLRALGHRVTVDVTFREGHFDLVVALHARKSAGAITAAHARGIPSVVAMTGTDLYRDIHQSPAAQRALDLADRVVVLHEGGGDALPRRVRSKVHVIPQSAVPSRRARARSSARFEVVVVGHLREEKDPFRAAEAARALPASSRVRVTQVGAALSPQMRRRALCEARDNVRYRWVGERSPAATRAAIARSHVMVLSSLIEGGANVLSEAIAAGTPILASRIPSSASVLGRDHPGLFAVGNTRALARLLRRAEDDRAFYRSLEQATRARRSGLRPSVETAAWRALLRELPRLG